MPSKSSQPNQERAEKWNQSSGASMNLKAIMSCQLPTEERPHHYNEKHLIISNDLLNTLIKRK